MFVFIDHQCNLGRAVMQRRGFLGAALVLAIGVLTACTPTFNWREVGFDSVPLRALLPCKPDRAERSVVLAGHSLVMHMAGCQAGGAMFTVSWVRVSALSEVQSVLTDLQRLGQASHRREVVSGVVIAQAAVYGQPTELGAGSAAAKSQVIETFLGQLDLAATR